MAVRILMGTTHRDREMLLWDVLAPAGDSREVDALFLVPTRRRAISLTKALQRRFEGRCWLPLVLTFEELFDRYAFEGEDLEAYVSEEARLRLIEALWLRLSRERHLSRGFVRAMAEGMAWIHREQAGREVPLEELVTTFQLDSPLIARFVDLASQYRTLLQAHHLFDKHLRAETLIETWQREGFTDPCRFLVLDEFSAWDPLERSALKALFPSFKEIVVTLAIPDEGADALESHRAFEGIREMLVFLEPYLPQRIVAKPSERRSTSAEVAQRLFQRQTKPLESREPTFRLLRCANRREEVRTVARLIRERLRFTSPSWDRFVVVVPTWRPYQSLIEETFREYGLPTTFGRGVPLSEIPALRRIAKALSALGESPEGWTPEVLRDVFGETSLPEGPSLRERMEQLLRRPAEEPTLPFDVNRLVTWTQQAGISDSFHAESWFDRVVLAWEGVGERESSEENGKWRCQLAHDLVVVEDAIASFRRLLKATTPEAFGEGFRRLCVEYGLVRQTFPVSPEAPEYREYSGWNAFEDLLFEFEESFRILSSVTGNPFRGETFAEALAQAIADDIHQCFPPQNENGIRIFSPEQAIGDSYEHLFIVGMVEGEFPRKFSFVFDVPTWDALSLERFRFRELLRNAENVVLTYPVLELGHSMVRSPFLEDALDAYGNANVDEIAPLTDEERGSFFSAREVLVEMGQRQNAAGSEKLGLIGSNVPVLLRMEAYRLRLDGWSPYDGYLSETPAIRAALQTDATRHYTVSELEIYARCPIRYFFAFRLRLRVEDPFREDVAPNIRGQVVHEILEHFYRDLSVELDRTRLNRRMLLVSEQVLRRYDTFYPNLYWEEERYALLRGLKEAEPGVLMAFLDMECSSLYPVKGAFRRSFYSELEASLTLPRRDGSGSFKVVGRVDRVDLEPQTGKYVVFDYKTGLTPPLRHTKEGYAFQLPFYLLALRGWKECREGVASAFYSVKSPNEVGFSDVLYVEEEASEQNRNRSGRLSRDAFDAFLQKTLERLVELEEHIRRGRFHWTLASEEIAGCRFCPYREACRMNPSRRDRFHTSQPHYLVGSESVP